jgi:alpha 1,3-glucosidase
MQSWYDYETFSPVQLDADGRTRMETPLHKIPLYLRGGSIIPRKDRIRRSSKQMAVDPYTIIVALDKGQARGQVYADDGSSFEYQKGMFVLTEFEFKDFVLKASKSKQSTVNQSTPFNARIERIIIVGLQSIMNVVGKDGQTFEFSNDSHSITVKNPNYLIGDSWEIQFQR